MVPRVGVEPTRPLRALSPQDSASADSATWASTGIILYAKGVKIANGFH